MANDDKKPYTYDDLVDKMMSYTTAKGTLRDAEARRDTARSAMDSHQRDVDKAENEVARRKAEVRRIIDNLEK